MPKMKPSKKTNVKLTSPARKTKTLNLDDPLAIEGFGGGGSFDPYGDHNAFDLVNFSDIAGNYTYGGTNQFSSGGDNEPDKKNKIEKEFGEDFLFGSNRFNKLWTEYQRVKTLPGIENNPKYHALIKKISRKMPRTLKTFDRKFDSSVKKREEIMQKLNMENPVVQNKDKERARIKKSIFNFMRQPYATEEEKENAIAENLKINNSKLVKTKNEPGNEKRSKIDLGASRVNNPSLSSDIAAAFKNKKW